MSELIKILDGIDRDQIDGGWWETSTGVEFGALKLNEVLKLFNQLTQEKEALQKKLNNVQSVCDDLEGIIDTGNGKIKALEERVRELEKENFALAAGVCNNGYGDEHGNWVCNHNWISVEDKLPEDGKYLAFNGEINVAWYDHTDITMWQWQYGCYPITCVTHWMPLPATPKEQR